MTEQEAGRYKHALNARAYYWRNRDACLARIRAYYAANSEKWIGPSGYRAQRKTAQESRP